MRSRRGEGGVTLVEVCYLGLVAERRERTDAADTEHELLLDAGLLVAAVEPRRYVAIGSPIRLQVGVEKIKPVPSDEHSPYLGNDVAPRKRDLDPHWTTHGVACQLDGKALEVENLPRLLLQPAGVKPLMRRLPIEQADADQRNAERARRLEELAGDGTEATRVHWQRVGEGELRGKERNLETAVLPVRLREPVPGVIRLVGGRVLDDRGCESCKIRVGREPLLHCGPSQASQQAKRPFEGR